MGQYQQVGTIELKPHQHNLISQFAETILHGPFDKAVETFSIIFEREPENDFEMMVFKSLCEQKIEEKENPTGIKGVLKGGK